MARANPTLKRRGRPRKPGDFPRHVPRERVVRQTPVHVTIRVKPAASRLRSTRRFRVIRRALVKGGCASVFGSCTTRCSVTTSI